nr:hypothetical protein [Tanacetum cinerariifolium]
MALETSQAVVILKFDMHIYTSIFTTKELMHIIKEYCIPIDLHPRLPSPELTMDKLPSNVIRIYVEQLEQVLTMDDFLKLHLWNGTKVSKRSAEKLDAKIATFREKKKKQTAARIQAKRVGEGGSNIEKHIVDLSEDTHDLTPPVNMAQHEKQLIHFTPCTMKTTIKMRTNFDQVLSSLTNREVIRRTYQSLGQRILSQAKLLKRHDQLNIDYTGLYNRSKVVWEFILAVVNRLHSSIEYQKSLVVPIGLCSTAGWLGGLSLGKEEEEISAMLSETSDLDIEDALMKISPDVPPLATDDGA